MGDLFPASLGGLLINDARGKIGVDRHLLARKGVEGKAGDHLRNPPGALRHHDEIDDHQDAKDDETHEVIAADDEFPEGCDDLACRVRSLMAIHQYYPG